MKKNKKIQYVPLYIAIAFFLLSMTAYSSQKENKENDSVYEGYTLFNPQGSKITY